MTCSCPRIVIGGAHSGVGKTSVTLALVRAMTRRGMRVQTYKVGPDFLDPSYLTLASGRPCYNLDGWMMGEAYVRRLFGRTSADADIAIVEGVMGLFDGSDAETSGGSTAEIAKWLDAPVLLVAGAHGLARSFAALVKGYASFEPDVRIAGVIANQCGTDRHASWIADALRSSAQPPLVGAIPRGALPSLPSRHLGLVTADDRNLSTSVLDALADAIEAHARIDRIIEIARSAPSLCAEQSDVPHDQNAPRIGIAHDEAFHFYYQDLFDELSARGCELVRFSPIHDQRLPDGLDALYIGGGYPEEHAEALAANTSIMEEIRRFAQSGRPLYAECGGLMYLSEGIQTLDGEWFPMLGILPTRTRMLERKRSLGYVEATLIADSLWGAAGSALRGHEFHYSEMLTDPTVDAAWSTAYSIKRRRSDEATSEGFQYRNILTSYAHLHPASQPGAIDRFIENCRKRS